VKRRQLEQHLSAQGARKLDEGGNHTRWIVPSGKRSAAPRHRDIDHRLARAICKQLAVGPCGRDERPPSPGIHPTRRLKAGRNGRAARFAVMRTSDPDSTLRVRARATGGSDAQVLTLAAQQVAGGVNAALLVPAPPPVVVPPAPVANNEVAAPIVIGEPVKSKKQKKSR
jgi:hypothetical protein